MSSMLLRDPSASGADGRVESALASSGGPNPRWLDSAAVLRGGIEVFIRHGSDTYRLRVTRQNRLILTK